MSKTGDVLTAAIDLFKTRGWCQYDLEDPQGRLCAVGAVNSVMSGVAWSSQQVIDWDTRRDVMTALVAHMPDDWQQMQSVDHSMSAIELVVDYNNHPARTFEDMLDWFGKTAADEGVTP